MLHSPKVLNECMSNFGYDMSANLFRFRKSGAVALCMVGTRSTPGSRSISKPSRPGCCPKWQNDGSFLTKRPDLISMLMREGIHSRCTCRKLECRRSSGTSTSPSLERMHFRFPEALQIFMSFISIGSGHGIIGKWSRAHVQS